MLNDSLSTNLEPVIKCESVFKIFGNNANKLLENTNGPISAEEFQKAGCIIGVNNASFEIYKGEMLVVMGLSGSGKSTLIRHLNRLIDPTAGEILIDGENVMSLNPEQLIDFRRHKMSMVFQRFGLFPHKTVIENVGYGLEVQGQKPEERNKIAMEKIESVGLSGFEHQYPNQLSGGMQQRVALARCLINDPDLILMDEPLGALDALTREKMQSLVLKIWKETGKTIILITHSVEEALLLGERLYVMAPRPGRIHKEYNLPFASMGLKEDLREIKKNKDFSVKRDEILEMIWNMEEEIMGKEI